MAAYPECYVNEIVETQGKLFELVADTPSVDFEDFVKQYMIGKTRKYLDRADAYLSNLSEKELFEYFCKIDGFTPKKGNSLSGFAPDWIGQFYARSQWQKNIPSRKLVSILPPDFVKASYAGLHDLDLDLAVDKVFNNIRA
ncbi:MAG: hypothetical protein IJ630_11860 [Treponema sp.]|nr:hypothetical protein [Treponema sp.]